ncbi:GNAT family N-acetyltransferase [Leifsonia aquatica]|uniref:GNAT family N-acetyltransferase n=1 Tax=Leifsonia aquatica TaxID=144185 RepID=UPI0028B0ACB5|nr:GNAT family protein [Leifsonia aquatica]
MMMFPVRTDRLLLTPLVPVDRDAFVAYRQDPDIARWQSWTPAFSSADADVLLASQPTAVVPGSGTWLQVAIRSADTRALHGDVAVHALAEQPDTYELGVTLAPSAHGAGVATEALRAVVDALFRQLNAHRVFALTDARNDPASRLFTRLGFRHEGRAEEADWFKGEWTTVDTCALLKRDRSASPGHPDRLRPRAV